MTSSNTLKRAKANVEGLKLYVPNSHSYGARKAFDLFGSTYAYRNLVCTVDLVTARSNRRVSAVGRKSLRDWRVLSEDIKSAIVSSGVIIQEPYTIKKENYGNITGRTTRRESTEKGTFSGRLVARRSK